MRRRPLQRSAGRAGRGALAAGLAALALLALAGPAQAQKHQPLGVFGEAAQPAFANSPFGNGAHGLAVDPASGDLLVVDRTEPAGGHGAIRRFKPNGEDDDFSALGTNAIDGSATPQGSFGFFERRAQVAVAPPGAAGAGNIYVTRSSAPYLVDIFGPDGAFKGQLTEYEEVPGEAASLTPLGKACGVAVDGEGAVYVGDEGGDLVHKFAPAGDPPANTDSAANFAVEFTGSGCSLAAGAGPSAGALFVNAVARKVKKLDSESGALEYELATNKARTISVNEASGRLFVAEPPPGVEKVSEVLEYEASGEAAAEVELVSRVSLLEAGSPINVNTEITGIAASPALPPAERLYVSSSFGDVQIGEWGPVEKNPPTIEEEYTSSVGAGEATVNFTIGAEGAPTTYQVEYIDRAAYEAQGGFEGPETLRTPTRSATPSNSTVPYSVPLSGLREGTTYYWRAVAENECPPAEGACGPNQGPRAEFKTSVPHPPQLPDERVWELVSPRFGPAEFAVPGNVGGNAEFSVRPLQATADGEAITYASLTSLGEPELNEAEGAALVSQYLSRRGPGGWSSENLTPNFEEGYARDPVVGFSPDLSEASLITLNPPCAAGAAADLWSLCSLETASRAKTALTGEPAALGSEGGSFCLAYAGASEDFGRVYLMAMNAALLPGDPAPVGKGNMMNLYEWRATAPPGERLRLASVLPGGEAAEKLLPEIPVSTGFGGGKADVKYFQCSMEGTNLRHAVSTDGARAFWTYDGGFATELLARVPGPEGPRTIQLDESRGGGGSGKGVYRDATPDGRYVFFTDQNTLTPAPAQEEDLYRYDVAAGEAEEPGPLQNLTAREGEAARVQGLVGIGEAGDVAYFVAKGVLTTDPNPSTGKSAVAGEGKFNLYAWVEGGGTRFIATLGNADANDWSLDPSAQSARVSPDGQRVAFLSKAPLSGYDNTGPAGEAVSELFSLRPRRRRAALRLLQPDRRAARGPLLGARLPGPLPAAALPAGRRARLLRKR